MANLANVSETGLCSVSHEELRGYSIPCLWPMGSPCNKHTPVYPARLQRRPDRHPQWPRSLPNRRQHLLCSLLHYLDSDWDVPRANPHSSEVWLDREPCYMDQHRNNDT